ncbi:MAG: hypothetical protein OXN90_20115, partial [Gemmatimonadota bacterium]|nr:hypothetical protein [Gemmatimonadota bacterium]
LGLVPVGPGSETDDQDTEGGSDDGDDGDDSGGGGGGGGGNAMTVLSVECKATSTPVGANVTVEGTIRANRDVRNVRGWLTINGRAIDNGVPAIPHPTRGGYLGGRYLGDFSAGQTKSYSIFEMFIGGVSGRCGVTFWFEE